MSAIERVWYTTNNPPANLRDPDACACGAPLQAHENCPQDRGGTRCTDKACKNGRSCPNHGRFWR